MDGVLCPRSGLLYPVNTFSLNSVFFMKLSLDVVKRVSRLSSVPGKVSDSNVLTSGAQMSEEVVRGRVANPGKNSIVCTWESVRKKKITICPEVKINI